MGMVRISTIPRFLYVFNDTFRYARFVREQSKGGKLAPPEILHPLMKAWANTILGNLRAKVHLTGEPPSQDPVLFLGNHMSYLDIPVLMSVAPVVFVAKEELARWPVIGGACRSVGTVFVKRESKESRKGAGKAIADTFYREHHSICVFPSGTTTIREDKPWRWGAFEIAKLYDITVQPFRICYQPVRRCAFLMEDNLVAHLFRLLEEPQIDVHLEFAAPVKIRDVAADSTKWFAWNRESLRCKLLELGYRDSTTGAGETGLVANPAPA